MFKIYKTHDTTASLLFKDNDGKNKRIQFEGGTYPKFEGVYSTSDTEIQEMIERDARFGAYLTHQIFLYQSIGEPEKNEAIQVQPEITAEKPKSVLPTAGQMTFVQAKQHLIEKGVSPDELKNFLQVKSQAAKLGIEVVK